MLDGAAIALSITLLTSLSSRTASAHTRPHFLFVDISWCLLLLSVYCAYQVILKRHRAVLTSFVNLGSEMIVYHHGRIAVVLSAIGNIAKGSFKVGDAAFDVAQTFKNANAALNGLAMDEKSTLAAGLGLILFHLPQMWVP